MKNKLFIIKEIVLMALENVRSHKFRSFLTILGIIIGVVTVVAIASLLTGVRKSLIQTIEEFGTNNIYAFHLSTGINFGSRDRTEYQRKPLKEEDAIALREQSPAIKDVAQALFLNWQDSTINYQGTKYRRGNVSGVSPNYAQVVNLSIKEGRFFSEIDDQHRKNVLVIGTSVAEGLFSGKTRIIGEKVTLVGKEFEVIGILEKRKSSFLGENDEDNDVLIPYHTARKDSPRSEYIMLMIQAKSGQLPAALSQSEEILRRQRGVKFNEPNNFDLSTADRLVQQFDSITGMLGLVAIAISSIGLMVGGIGVMNIMLVSVTERTKEIGIRKAIGAQRKDIIIQFLCEAMTLTSLGGLIGVVLSVGVGQILILLFPSLPASIPIWAVVTGLSVSIFIGLVFGVWPAVKAARLDPIECLRYE